MKIIFNIVLILAFLITGCGGKKKTAHPVRKDLTQAVYASGKVYPEKYFKLIAKYPGYVKKIFVKPGDIISKGDTLLIIKNEQAELGTQAAKNLLQLAQKNAGSESDLLNIYRNDVIAAATKLQLDSMNFARYTQLLKENATTQVQYDQSKVSYEISKANYAKATKAYEGAKDKSSTEAQNALINYEVQIASNNDFVIISERAGKIFNLDVKEGDLINPQKMIMEIGNEMGYEVELNIDETDVELVKPGQKIIYEADAFKNNEKFEGQVEENYLSINPVNKTAKVISNIKFAKEQQVYAGMSVEANIIIEERKNILVIPREYVFDFNKVKVKGKEEPIMIKKGIEDLEFVEVMEGLSENDEIENPVK